MKPINPMLPPLAAGLVRALKRAAKLALKSDGQSNKLSHYLDERAVLLGFANWALLQRYLATATPGGTDTLISKARATPGLAHFPGRSQGADDETDPVEVMRAFVLAKYTPLNDFAFYDSESPNGYAWPEVELFDELSDEFSGRFSPDLIEEVARDMEMENGPWGIEDYGRDEDDQ